MDHAAALNTHPQKQKLGRAARKEQRRFFLYILPWIIGFLAFTVAPMIISMVFSFTDTQSLLDISTGNFSFLWGKSGTNAFGNYISALSDKYFLQSISTTFYYAIVRIGLGVFLSLLVAILLNQAIPLKRIFRTMIYMPSVLPIVGSAMLWSLLFSQDLSLFNYFLNAVGLPSIEWLNYNNAINSVLFMSIWCGIGPTMTILLAALQTVPQDLMEAADLDGCGPVKKFFYITIPIISSSLLYVVITGFIGALQAYAEMELLTGGNNKTTTMSMIVFKNRNEFFGEACAQGWIIFAITIIFTILFLRNMNKKVYYAGGDE